MFKYHTRGLLFTANYSFSGIACIYQYFQEVAFHSMKDNLLQDERWHFRV